MKILLLQVIFTSILLGLIWTIQLVHYPSFKYIDKEAFLKFHVFHSMKISILVIPLMLIEAFLAWHWFFVSRDFLSSLHLFFWALVWIFTFLWIVPIHNGLGNGKEEILLQRLVQWNWLRTLAWTGKAFVLYYLVWKQGLFSSFR